MVTARFYVNEITRYAGAASVAKIKLTPAYKDGANKAWSQATPSGLIELQVSNPDAIEWFDEQRQAGKDLHITFDTVAD